LGNWLKIGIPVIAVAILSITIISISAEEELIPSWIKNTASFWIDGGVSDLEFLNAIEFLVNDGIIQVHTDELQQLQEENKILREENDILRKTSISLSEEIEKLEKQTFESSLPEPKPVSESELLDLVMIDCDSVSEDFLKVSFSATSHVDVIIDLEIAVLGLDENGEIVSIKKYTIYDLNPEQTKYEYAFLDEHPNLVSCTIRVNEAREVP